MKFALWLMHRFAVDPALAGDLSEEWAYGRSPLWLARQTSVAIASALASGLWSHKLRTVAAIAGGWVSIYVFQFVFWSGVMRATSGRWYLVPPFLIWPVLAGWTAGKIQRAQPMGAVLLFIATFVAGVLSRGVIPEGLLVLFSRMSPVLAGMLFGGLVAARKPSDSRVPG